MTAKNKPQEEKKDAADVLKLLLQENNIVLRTQTSISIKPEYKNIVSQSIIDALNAGIFEAKCTVVAQYDDKG